MSLLHLDTLPISNYDNSLRYRKEYNLGLNNSLMLDRVKEEQERIEEFVATSDLTVGALTKGIESYLYNLLFLNTLSNLRQNELTEHYIRYQALVSRVPRFPSDTYLSDILYTKKQTWGGPYGSLSYYLHIAEDTSNYLHPSDNIYRCSKQLIKTTGDSNYQFSFNRAIDNEKIQGDFEVFTLQQSILDLVRDGVKFISFIEEYAPRLLVWYIESLRQFGRLPTNDGDQEAYDLLITICRLLTQNLLDERSFKDLKYFFVHQYISPVFFNLFTELITIRKRQAVLVEKDSTVNTLAAQLIEGIPITLDENIVRTSSQILLDFLPAPSGYNLLLVCIAANLVNRAYALCYNTNSDIPLTGLNIENINRAYSLLYMGGYTLKKSTLPHIRLTGNNLIVLSGMPDDSLSKITTL